MARNCYDKNCKQQRKKQNGRRIRGVTNFNSERVQVEEEQRDDDNDK